jgi:hypothetical protein
VEVQIPDSPQFSGKELRVRLDLEATYPEGQGAHFVNKQRAFTHTAIVQLADRPGASKVYTALSDGGTLCGVLWLVLMSLAIALAARSFRHEALPAKAFAEDEDEDEDGHPGRPIRSRRIRDE